MDEFSNEESSKDLLTVLLQKGNWICTFISCISHLFLSGMRGMQQISNSPLKLSLYNKNLMGLSLFLCKNLPFLSSQQQFFMILCQRRFQTLKNFPLGIFLLAILLKSEAQSIGEIGLKHLRFFQTFSKVSDHKTLVLSLSHILRLGTESRSFQRAFL